MDGELVSQQEQSLAIGVVVYKVQHKQAQQLLELTKLFAKTSVLFIKLPQAYTEQKKLRKFQKSMQHKETIANNYSIFIYVFRYMSSVDKNVYLSLLAPIPLMWHSVK